MCISGRREWRGSGPFATLEEATIFVKEQFQEIYKDAERATEIFNANRIYFNLNEIAELDDLIRLANEGQLVNHKLLSKIKVY